MTEIPFVKDLDFDVGVPDQLSPLVRRVIAGNGGPFTYTGTGVYLIGKQNSAIAVIDPGPDDRDHLNALERAIGDSKVSHIFITHTHADHCGGARAFAKCVSAPIYGFGGHPADNADDDAPALDEGGDYRFQPDELLKDGDIVFGGDWSLEAIHTPGHLSNHLCFSLKEEKALFSGDHIMGWATSVIAPPHGNMADYLSSLEKILQRDEQRYYPTHGAPIEEPHRFVRAVRAHRHIRDGQILDQLAQGKSRIMDMVPIMYAGVNPILHGAAALNVLAHLIRLVEIGSVTANGELGLETTFTLAAQKEHNVRLTHNQ
ncbi:MAG: MBL fold metallo-hydrolase [Pseudomonadota bacterium]